MATPARQDAASADSRPGAAVAAPQTVARLRAMVLGRRGGGTTRRRASATEPGKIGYVLAGSMASQLLVALALGASLHAVAEKVSIATLLVVVTTASMIGGAIPVPGAGVVKAGLIAGLTSAGIPQDQAVAAAFIQRLFTADLPPIWGLGDAGLDAAP